MRNTRILNLILQAVERVLNNFVVIEGQLGQLVYREPLNVLMHASVRHLSGGNRCPVHHRYHTLVIGSGGRNRGAVQTGRACLRGAQNVTKCVELLQVAGLQIGQGKASRLLQGESRLEGATG